MAFFLFVSVIKNHSFVKIKRYQQQQQQKQKMEKILFFNVNHRILNPHAEFHKSYERTNQHPYPVRTNKPLYVSREIRALLLVYKEIFKADR